MDDHRMVRLALEHGMISREQLEHARREQKVLADRGVEHDLWFLVQELGFVTDDQAKRLRKGLSSATLRALEIDGYTIQGRLGSGGMGDVFRARNPAGHEVAVKLLSSRYASNQEYQERFTREARATMRLRHPHVVTTISAGESNGCRYLMMELVEGPSLKARITEQGPLGDADAKVVLRQIGSALQHAWAQGVLHRDVKPANIILGPARPGTDEPFCAKLCDFGLARIDAREGEADTSMHGQLTGPGLALGTPHYMSPEQASGDHDLDQRCDIYGLGASIYHAMCGRTLFSGKSSAVIMYKQVTEQIDVDELRRDGHQASLVRLLGRMLAKDRVQRIPTWDEVLLQLDASTRHSTTGFRPPRELPASAPRARRGLLVVAGAMLAVAAAAAGAWWWLDPSAGPRRTATPATLPALLADSALSPGRVRELRLEPGRYQGPWRLGAGHAGLTLRASGGGVELVGAPGEPALRCEPGCDAVTVDGLVITGDAAPALQVLPGARLTVAGTVLRGAPAVQVQGRLALARCRVEGPVEAGPQAELRLDGGSIAARAPALSGDAAGIHVTTLRLSGGARVRGGTLRLSGVEIEADGAPAALELERVTEARLEDCLLRGGTTALRSAGSALARAARVTLVSSGTAAVWSGPVDPAWAWEGLRIDAPAIGLPGVSGDGAGADPTRLPR